jgi:hypothetical protein
MPIIDIFRINKIKDELNRTTQERDALKAALTKLGGMDAAAIQLAIADLEHRRSAVAQELRDSEVAAARRRAELGQSLTDLEKQITAKQTNLVILDEAIQLQSFALYKPHYDLGSSESYKKKLEQIQDRQAAMVKAGTAASASQTWSINGDAKTGARMVNDFVKLILRAFNNECEAAIDSVKFSNIETIENRIRKAHETMNKLGVQMHISISNEYFLLKLQELRLVFEYRQKKQEEKEEQRRIREQLREEAKAMREIEEAKEKLAKEERHFIKAVEQLNKQLAVASSDVERAELERERAAAINQLQHIEKDKLDILNREQNTRAGYVYIISNVGAFGENVFKIGVTRRLDPQERVDELGDASVPFEFDVHALIFSEDAPALENALHKAFESRRINMVNRRREFFHVPLTEIKDVVRRNFKKPVEFVEIPDAEQYRESLRMRVPSNGISPT